MELPAAPPVVAPDDVPAPVDVPVGTLVLVPLDVLFEGEEVDPLPLLVPELVLPLELGDIELDVPEPDPFNVPVPDGVVALEDGVPVEGFVVAPGAVFGLEVLGFVVEFGLTVLEGPL